MSEKSKDLKPIGSEKEQVDFQEIQHEDTFDSMADDSFEMSTELDEEM